MKQAVGVLGCAVIVAVVGCCWSAFRTPWYRAPAEGDPEIIPHFPCGPDVRWKVLASLLYEESLAGPVEDFGPVLLSYPAGMQGRHRALERTFISSLLANRPCLVDASLSMDNNRLWIPKSVLWNVSDVPTKIDTPSTKYNSKVFEYIRQNLTRSEIGTDIRRIFVQQGPTRFVTSEPIIDLERDVLAPARSFWGESMPENVKMLHQSIESMTIDTRAGCVWHFLYRMSEELRAQVSMALFEVAQKSNLLPQNASFQKELNARRMADFFHIRYGNLWMPRATMTDALTTLFPNIDAEAIPVYVAAHHRGTDVGNAASTIVPCAIAFGDTDRVKVLVASDTENLKASVRRQFPSQVITLSATDRSSSKQEGDEYSQAYTELVVLSLVHKFVGSSSGFSFAAANLGFVDRYHFIAGGTDKTRPRYSACVGDYRHLPPRPDKRLF